MANENIKIIVQEVDETRPRGSGASSDIVYVPGLAHDLIPDEYTNRPILCNSVEQFESYFGSEPYKFTTNDASASVNHSSGCKVTAGEYDKSYIYAKELLNAGLSVLYENVSPEKTAHENLATFNTGSNSGFSKLSGTRNIFRVNSPEKEISGSVTFQFENMVNYGNLTLLLKSVVDPIWVPADENEVFNVKIDSVTATTGCNVTATDPKENDGEYSNLTWNDENVNGKLVTINIKAQGKGDFSLVLIHGDDFNTTTLDTGSDRFTYFFDNVSDCFETLKDKNEYTVKYLTLGGYPSFFSSQKSIGGQLVEDCFLAAKMLDCAASRNDTVALIDHKDDSSAILWGEGSIYSEVNEYFKNAANTEFGAMFTPWGNYTCTTIPDASTQAMPASFGYLLCLAKAIKTSPNWLAMAGVTRGIVPGLQKLRTNKVLSNVIAENYQPKYGDIDETNVVSVNAITNVKPYGLTIWGNRTLKRVAQNGTVATNFLNIRNMMSDIKKLAYNTAKSLMFEQESDSLWLSFKSGVSPLLDQLKSGYGISDYKLIKNTTKYNGKALTRGEMSAVIKIFPLYAVEYFEITVVVSDNDVAVS